MIGTWKWTKSDYDVPLVFQLNGVKVRLTLEYFAHQKQRDREVIWNADLSFEFTNPSPEFIRGLKTSGKLSQDAAEVIYGHYLQIQERFEGILRTAGGVRNLMLDSPLSIKSFFEKGTTDAHGCMWRIAGEKAKPFNPKLSQGRRSINPLFRSDQIITKAKWKRLQLAIDNHDFPATELLALLRIRAALQWRDKKIPTIEAAILVETILREYAEKALVARGFSNKRIKALQNDLTFNTFLNIVLPLSLTRGEATKIENDVSKVDVLRKIRNDIVHGNIGPGDIDEKNVRDGIEGALALVTFIRKKLHGT